MTTRTIMPMSKTDLSVMYSALMQRERKLRESVIFFEKRREEAYADKAFAELQNTTTLLQRVRAALNNMKD